MAYLAPKYKHDVFVSYAHGAREGNVQPLLTWTHGLIPPLIADIKNFGKGTTEFADLNIWYDYKIDPTKGLTSGLRNAVKGSAILMIVMSPPYLESDWCGQELDWFAEQIRSRRGDGGRIFIVRSIYTDRDSWPPFLRDDDEEPILGFKFHAEPTDEDPVPEPYGYPDLIDRNEAFRKELKRLRTILMGRLREMRRDVGQPEPAVQPPLPPRPPRVYLHTRPDADGTRNSVTTKLLRKGFEIAPVPSVNGGESAEIDARVKEVSTSDALVLVRSRDEPAFVGDLLQVGVAERMQIAPKNVPCVVLDSADTELPLPPKWRIERLSIKEERWPDSFVDWFAKNQPAAHELHR